MAKTPALTLTRRRARARPRRRRFTVEEYYRMVEVGLLHEDDRVELIEGDIIEMAAIGSRHAGCVNVVSLWFIRRLQDRVVVTVQNPVRLSQRLEPQPDIMLLRPRADFYRQSHPTAEDVLLLIEVADTSLGYDRRRKLPLYARAGIAEVWIVDLDGQRVEAYREPAGPRYALMAVHERGGSLGPAAFPDLQITVDEILG